MHLKITAVCLLALAPGLVPAQGRSTTTGADPTGAVAVSAGHDLIFFSDHRPIQLRLHIEVDGQSLQTIRNDYVKRWLDFLDRDGDGVLNKDEAHLVPAAQVLQQFSQGNPLFAGPGTTMDELDTNRDGRVSLDELIAHFDRSGFGALQQAAPTGIAPQLNAANEALFRFLDPQKTGKLAKARFPELASTLLRKLDADDDELISLAELTFTTSDPGLRFVDQAQLGGRVPPTGAFLLVRPADSPKLLAQRLLALYDKDKNGKLSFEESGLRRSTFAQLDKNEDGQLDADELTRLAQQTPDLELQVRLGKTREPAVDLKPSKRPAPLADAFEKGKDGKSVLKVGDAQIAFDRGDRGATTFGRVDAQFYVQQFRAADTMKKGFLEMQDVQGLQFFRSVFSLMDRDANGKLTLQEVQAFADLQSSAQKCFATLTIQELGRGLFQLLDANRDGMLSLRELRTAWTRLAPLDKNNDGCISPDEIARQFTVALNPGPASFGGRVIVVNPDGRAGFTPPRTAPTRGPLWFRKMDKNGDGDVSFKEFLGSREEFNRIDTDGDGLIDADEAERYDATLRERKRTGR